MDNINLQKTYNKVYKEGSLKFFTFNDYNAAKTTLDFMDSWENLKVLEIGCGEGVLASMIANANAKKIDALDYSKESIKIAKRKYNLENLNFYNIDYNDFNQGVKTYDVIALQGVLEHFDDPFVELKNIIHKFLKKDGSIITSSPSFLNPRGYVWMTLQLLFDVPMSLSDLYFLCPFDFEEFCLNNNYFLEYRSCDHDWGSGERTIVDFRKRLKNALNDAKMDSSKVEHLLEWLSKAIKYSEKTNYNGATVVYKIKRSDSI